MRRIFTLLLVSLVLAGCVERATMPKLMSADQPDAGEKADLAEWQEYGAVYFYDELRVVANFDHSDRRFSTRYTINQALKILDRTGVKHGTFEVRRFKGDLKDFELELFDKQGRPLLVDTEPIREQFLETGKIVVPQVQPGSEIRLQLSFLDNGALPFLHHLLAKPIPVLQSRLTFLRSHDFDYIFKGYNLDAEPREIEANGLRGFTIDQRNILPITNREEMELAFLADIFIIEDLPRAAIQLKKFWIPGHQYKAPGWDKIAEDYTRYYHSPSIFATTAKLEKITDEVTRKKGSETRKAEAILKYVQNNISLERFDPENASRVSLNTVLEERSGTPLEISVLLAEMFKAAGLKTRRYVTLAPGQGRFDPDLPSWNQLQIPLISVKVDAGEQIAYPYIPYYRLGEYPPESDGQYALDLDSGKPVKLPASPHTNGKILSSVKLDMSSLDSAQHNWNYSLKNHFGPRFRFHFNSASSYDLERAGKAILADYADQHMLEQAKLANTHIRTGDILLNFSFTNSTLSVDHPNGRIVALNPFFKKFFTGAAVSTQKTFHNDMELVFEEEVLLNHIDTANTIVSFVCEEMDNTLFTNACSQETYPDSTILHRTLTMKKSVLSQEEMQALLPDIRRLNRIDESNVVIGR